MLWSSYNLFLIINYSTIFSSKKYSPFSVWLNKNDSQINPQFHFYSANGQELNLFTKVGKESNNPNHMQIF